MIPFAAGCDRRLLDNHLGGADAVNYRRFERDLVSPHCGRRVLEIGSGLGDFAAGLRGYDHLTVSDTDPLCLRTLRDRFAGRADVDVIMLDVAALTGTELPEGAAPVPRPVDTLIMMNVLEHIEDDVAALRGLSRLVVPGGRVVLWVPAYPALYGEFDRMVGHFRRYTPATLRRPVELAGLRVERMHPVNLLGAFAWWVAVRRAGQRGVDPRLVRLYDRVVVPTSRFVEQRMRVPFGQSVLCVATRPVT
ncbi:bifunctional 2-polyprenyl-6-hydroxyphenol methylase/3-demethylubiquinol 3-O-methyltransferase UbiG [Frankia sp. CiP3]|uniref:class I SAM-dependent methyltransferase n=1 Tax=Frankia sp. CiP3 TaxID=2880971 RepID=UPI001EF5328E|nr:methyltransferase domain-containing protein [Frankia sp. CiP3]